MALVSNIQMLAFKFYTNLSNISKQTQISVIIRMKTDRAMDLLTMFQPYAFYLYCIHILGTKITGWGLPASST